MISWRLVWIVRICVYIVPEINKGAASGTLSARSPILEKHDRNPLKPCYMEGQ